MEVQPIIVEHFHKYGIDYSFAENLTPDAFKDKIEKKVIYIETPSNPLMKIVDLKAIADLAKSNNLVTMIDNTFASPVNRIPWPWDRYCSPFGNEIFRGHSDILAGAVACSSLHDAYICKKVWEEILVSSVWLLERSIKPCLYG